jgi:hypothetical protein
VSVITRWWLSIGRDRVVPALHAGLRSCSRAGKPADCPHPLLSRIGKGGAALRERYTVQWSYLVAEVPRPLGGREASKLG